MLSVRMVAARAPRRRVSPPDFDGVASAVAVAALGGSGGGGGSGACSTAAAVATCGAGRLNMEPISAPELGVRIVGQDGTRPALP